MNFPLLEMLPIKTTSFVSFVWIVVFISIGLIFPRVTEGREKLDPPKFKQCWQYKSADGYGNGIAADAAAVYVSTSDGGIRAIDVENGRDIWTTELGGAIISNLAAAEDALYVVSSPSEATPVNVQLRSLSKQTGITNWITQLPTAGRVWIGLENGLVVAVADSGYAVAISASDRTIAWKAGVSGMAAEPVLLGDALLVPAAGEHVQVLSLSGGRQTTTFAMKAEPSAMAPVFDDEIGIGDDRGNIAVFKLRGGEPNWTQKNGARIASIQRTKHGALVTSFDNFVYMLSPNGGIVWKRRLPARPSMKPVMVGETVLVSTAAGPEIFALGLNNGKVTDQAAIDAGAVGGAAIPGRTAAVIMGAAGTLKLFSFDGCGARK